MAKGVELKNSHNVQVESYILFWGEFLELQETAPQVTPRELLQGDGGEGTSILLSNLWIEP